MTTTTLAKDRTVVAIKADTDTVKVSISYDGYPNPPFTHRTTDPAATAARKQAQYLAAGFKEVR